MQLFKTLASFSIVLMFAVACEQGEQVSRTSSLLANAPQAGSAENTSTRVNDLRGTLNGRRGDTRRLGTDELLGCLLYTSPSPRDQRGSRMPSSA